MLHATATNTPTDQALPLLLDDLKRTNDWLNELDWEFKDAADKRRKLIECIDKLIQTVPQKVRERHIHRYATLSGGRKGRKRELQGRMKDIIAFLIDREHEHVRAAELTWYARRAGHKVGFRYGSNTLSRLAQTGHVTKTGHGIYRINRHHPDMMAIRMDLYDRDMKKAFGVATSSV